MEKAAGILNAECAAELATWDLTAVASEDDAGIVNVTNEKGEWVFSVTAGIAPSDLKTLLRYGQRQKASGEKEGRAKLQAEFRVMMNLQDVNA